MMQPAAIDNEDISSVISQMPFAPVSMFLNDLARPLLLNNIVPAPEAILSMKDRHLHFDQQIKVSPALLAAAQFDPRNFMLNEAPVKEVAHDYDEFMCAVLEDCFAVEAVVYTEESLPAMTIPQPNIKAKGSADSPAKMASNKVKLNVNSAFIASDALGAFRKLCTDDAFVSPLCFDCRDDLGSLVRIIRSLLASPPCSADLPELSSQIPIFTQFIRDYSDCLQEQRIEKSDTAKALYCLCLIALCNIHRAGQSSAMAGVYFPVDELMNIVKTAIESDLTSDDRGDVEGITALVIDSYTGLQGVFALPESEVSSLASHLLDLFFSLLLQSGHRVQRACAEGLVAAFKSHGGVFATWILEQGMSRALDADSPGLLRSASALLLLLLQDNPSHLNFILNYLWKGDGSELPRGAALFNHLFEDLLQTANNTEKWPASPLILNQCCLQMFHALLKSDLAVKGAVLLKLRFLDQLTSAAISKSEGRNRGLLAALESSSRQPERDQNFTQDTLSALKLIPERVAGLLIKLISMSEAVQFRSRAIKNLYLLMSSSSNGALSSSNSSSLQLKQSILMRVHDSSTSVRDAVLEFISRLLLEGKALPELASEMITSVLSRLKDRGVSVRKRAIKIVGEMLLQREKFASEVRVECVRQLLHHLPDEEEDTLEELCFKTLKDNWLQAWTSNHAGFATELSCILGSSSNTMSVLQSFLLRVLKQTTSNGNDLSVFLKQSVDGLLEGLVRALEANDLPRLKDALRAIAVLACQPECLLGHLGLLQSLLRSEDVEVSLAALRLFNTLLPSASLAELKKLDSQLMERDLLAFVYRGSEEAVVLAVESLYLFVNTCSHQYSTLSALWTRFTGYLQEKRAILTASNDDDEQSNTTAVMSLPANLARALIATGALGAQSSLHREREFGDTDVHNGPQMKQLLELVRFYYTACPWPLVRTCSLQSLGSLLAVCPQLPVIDLLKDALDSPDLCPSALSILEDSCKRASNLSANSGDLKVINAGNGKEAHHAYLLQSLLSNICQVIVKNSQASQRALKLASTAAVVGLVNPHHVLPFICVGMGLPGLEHFSQIAFDRLMTRFPSLLPRDLTHIARLQYASLPQNSKGFLEDDSSRLAELYSCLQKRNKKEKRLELLSGLMASIEKYFSPESETSEGDAQFICFLIEAVVTLPLTGSDEVGLLLTRIQGVFAMAEDYQTGDWSAVFAILQVLSAAIVYLAKSYPTCLTEQEEASMRSVSRCLSKFEYKLVEGEVSEERVREYLNSRPPLHQIFSSLKRKNIPSKSILDEEELLEELPELVEDDSELDESEGGSSSEEFEAMLREFDSQRKGVIADEKGKKGKKSSGGKDSGSGKRKSKVNPSKQLTKKSKK